MLFKKTNLEALWHFELNLIHKSKLRSIIEHRIKPYSQKNNLGALSNFELKLNQKKKLEALLNFELNLIHKEKRRSINEIGI